MECGKGRRKSLLCGLILAWMFVTDSIVTARNLGEFDFKNLQIFTVPTGHLDCPYSVCQRSTISIPRNEHV